MKKILCIQLVYISTPLPAFEHLDSMYPHSGYFLAFSILKELLVFHFLKTLPYIPNFFSFSSIFNIFIVSSIFFFMFLQIFFRIWSRIITKDCFGFLLFFIFGNYVEKLVKCSLTFVFFVWFGDRPSWSSTLLRPLGCHVQSRINGGNYLFFSVKNFSAFCFQIYWK